MRYLRFVVILFAALALFANEARSQKSLKVNPSGTYTYSAKSYMKNGERYGYFGTIKVLQLDSNRVLMNFYICKGAPSYNSGSFIDTLHYEINQAIYRGDSTFKETTCKLTFTFTSKNVHANLVSDYPNQACGFGHGVDAHGFFKKLKRKKPTMEEMLQDPLTGE